MTAEPTDRPTPPVASPTLGETSLCLAIGLGALAATFLGSSLSPARPTAQLAAGSALGALLCAILFSSRLGRPTGGVDGRRILAAIAFGIHAAALAAHAGEAIPSDLHLFTLSRPPALATAIPLLFAGLSWFGARTILRGDSPRLAFLLLLVPACALEGLPLATPATAMLTVGCGALAIARGRKPLPRFPLVATFTLLFATLLAGLLGADLGTSFDAILRLGALAILLIVVAGEGRDGAVLAVRAIAWTALGIAALAVYSKWALGVALSSVDGRSASSGLSLFGRHPNLLAPWFGASALLCGHLALHDGSRAARWLGALGSLACAALLALTASRLAIVATLGAALLPMVARLRFTRRALPIVGAVIGVAALAIITLPALREKFTERTNLQRSVDHRAFRIGVGIETALASPWMGHGPLCWFVQGEHTKPSYFDGESSADHPHCLPVAILEGSGALGLGAFALLLFAFARAARRAVASTDPDAVLARGALLASIAQLATNLLDLGDALETTVPSRLFLDFGIVLAVAPRAVPAAIAGSFSRAVRLCLAALLGAFALLTAYGEAFHERGRVFTRVGLTARALPELERSIALVPFITDVELDLATASFLAAKRAAARDWIERAIARAPGRPDLQEALANLRSGTGDPSGALAAARRAFELDPHGATPRRLALVLAELEMAAGNEERALDLLATAMRIDIHSLEPLCSEATPGAIRIGGKTVTLDALTARYDAQFGSSDPRLMRTKFMRSIELALMSFDIDRAVLALAELRALNPEDPTMLKFAATVAKAQGRLADARLAIEEAIRLHPIDPTLHADRADILLALGASEDAIAEYEKAFPEAFDVYYQTSSYHDALTRLERALATRGATAQRAAVLRTLAFFKRAPEERASAFLTLCDVEIGNGNTEAALAAAQRAMREILDATASTPNRERARAIGVALARIGRERPDRSRFADDIESAAFARAPGILTLELRTSLLTELGLDRRAQAARAELTSR